jgi:glucose/arabinose dehydrogenase
MRDALYRVTVNRFRSPSMSARAVTLHLALISLCVTSACRSAPAQIGPAQKSTNAVEMPDALRVETVARGLEHPWGIAILPDGRFLVTERPGRLRLITSQGAVSPPLAGVPAVYAEGQGGLLDVALDPAFARNRVIYLSYAEPGDGGTASTAVARARLAASDDRLDSVTVIYRQLPKVVSGNHFGSRIVFARDGKVFITQGERFLFRNQAQDLMSDLGKVVRVRPDGSIPPDNPFVGRSGAKPEIWSYGHRNVEAAALDPATGQLWTIEHGAAGGDELNHPDAGKNYGWPVITYGRDYNGDKIGIGVAADGMEQPVYYWDPVIAPSGMTFYTGNRFAGWEGSILVGGLASERLVRLVLQNGHVVREERYLGDVGSRIRDVQEGADGLLYVVTDEGSGRLLRLSPP